MHFSTSVLLSSLFSLSLALPSGLSRDLGNDAPVARPGRLNVSYESEAMHFSQVSALYGDPVASQPFTIKAYNSESAIHMMNITASYNKFWVGNVTGNRCPPPAAIKAAPWAKANDCPAGNETALEVTGTGEAHLVRDRAHRAMEIPADTDSGCRCQRGSGHIPWTTRSAEI